MGQQRRDTGPQRAAKKRRAERTRCPACGRKGALSHDFDGWFHTTWCRYCEYAELHERADAAELLGRDE
jgi:hypothetical protein